MMKDVSKGDGDNDNNDDEGQEDFATSMVDRLKRRAAKTVAQQKSKRQRETTTKTVTATKEEKKSNNNTTTKTVTATKEEKKSNNNTNATILKKKDISIPKKVKTAIPKKATIDYETTTKTFLLSGMKRPDKSSSRGGDSDGAVTTVTGRSSSPPRSLSTFHQRSHSPPRQKNKNIVVNLTTSLPPHQPTGQKNTSANSDDDGDNNNNNNNNNATSLGTSHYQGRDESSRKNKKEDEQDKFGSGLRQLVWDGLRDLCKSTFPTPPIRDGVDLQASFLRYKDRNSSNQRYDFFDTDDANNIMLQPKIPIFPEDFPPGGSFQEWPLSWWGIIDPSIEGKMVEGMKNEPNNDNDIELAKHSQANERKTSGSKSDRTKSKDHNRCDSNKNKNNNNSRTRSGRKRSSDDRYNRDEQSTSSSYEGRYHHREPFGNNNFRHLEQGRRSDERRRR